MASESDGAPTPKGGSLSSQRKSPSSLRDPLYHAPTVVHALSLSREGSFSSFRESGSLLDALDGEDMPLSRRRSRTSSSFNFSLGKEAGCICDWEDTLSAHSHGSPAMPSSPAFLSRPGSAAAVHSPQWRQACMPSATQLSRVSSVHEAAMAALSPAPRLTSLLGSHLGIGHGQPSSTGSLSSSQHGQVCIMGSPKASMGAGQPSTIVALASASSMSSLSSQLGGGGGHSGGGASSGAQGSLPLGHMQTASSLSSLSSQLGPGGGWADHLVGSAADPQASVPMLKRGQEGAQLHPQHPQQPQPDNCPSSPSPWRLCSAHTPCAGTRPLTIPKPHPHAPLPQQLHHPLPLQQQQQQQQQQQPEALPPAVPKVATHEGEVQQQQQQQQAPLNGSASTSPGRSLSTSLLSLTPSFKKDRHKGDNAGPGANFRGAPPQPQPPQQLSRPVLRSPRRQSWALSPFSSHSSNMVVPTVAQQDGAPLLLAAGGGAGAGGRTGSCPALPTEAGQEGCRAGCASAAHVGIRSGSSPAWGEGTRGNGGQDGWRVEGRFVVAGEPSFVTGNSSHTGYEPGAGGMGRGGDGSAPAVCTEAERGGAKGGA